MPRGDGTGPNGLGSMTGRGLGYCAGYNTPGYIKGPGMNSGARWGRGLGYGRGLFLRRGRGQGFWSPLNASYIEGVPVYNTFTPRAIQNINPENQLAILKQEREYLESEIKGITNAVSDISKKISELEKKE